MAWLPHGVSETGIIFPDGLGQSATVPAVANYRGRLWCLWTDLQGQLWYAQTNGGGSAEQFSARQPFPQDGLPVLTNLNGALHVIIVQPQSSELAHYVHDDDDAASGWTALGALDTQAGFVTHSTPAIAAFHNKLFLAFLFDGQLYYSIWRELGPEAKRWTQPALVVDGDDDGQRFQGIPALCVMDNMLHLLCGADTEERHILGFRFDYIEQTWTQCSDVSEGRAASGVSAVSFGSSAYLGIIEAGPGDETHAVYVAAFRDGAWEPHEAVADAVASDPPQIAILNGRVHCLFNDRTETRDLRWYSRPVLRYELGSWMGGLADEQRLSELTIPGTHDSCARSRIPFVRTQYLSISQQLALGIRFLDLRLRLHKDGGLYCYHGGVAIDYPRHLSFVSVMDEVWQFLWPQGAAAPPTETVLVSINNDDTSKKQKAVPEVFYRGVAAAIAAMGMGPDGRARWHTAPTTPRLGEVRGQAVLLRRFAGDAGVPAGEQMGLDLSAWLDDNPDFTIVTPRAERVRLQDKWKYAERIALRDLVQSKAQFVQQMMARAMGNVVAEDEEEQEPHDWYINFCSAVGDPAEHGEIAEAKWIAVGAHSDFIGKWVPGMNVQTREHLQTQIGTGERARLGVVNLDYPELPEGNDLVARLIGTNF